jgi:DNA mismatch endonuclease (patch repair protein)
MMRAVGQRYTEEERLVGTLLRQLHSRFRANVRSLPGSPDFANRARKWAIFVHGCFWHGHLNCRVTKGGGSGRVPVRNAGYWSRKLDDNRRRDRAKAARLRRLGFRVLTVWGCQLRDRDRVLRALRSFLDRAR